MTEERKCKECNRNTAAPGDTLCRSCRQAKEIREELTLSAERRRNDQSTLLYDMQIDARLKENGG